MLNVLLLIVHRLVVVCPVKVVVTCICPNKRSSFQLAAGGDAGIVFFAEWPFERWFMFCYVMRHEQSIHFGCVLLSGRDELTKLVWLILLKWKLNCLCGSRPFRHWLFSGHNICYWDVSSDIDFLWFYIHVLMPSTYQVLLQCSIDSLRLVPYSCVPPYSMCFR